MTASGWYHAEGDPVGTTRFWDGERWVGDPQFSGPATPSASDASGAFGGPGAPGANLASSGARFGARAIDFVVAIVILLVMLGSALGGFFDDIDRLGPDPDQAEFEQVAEDFVNDNLGTLTAFVFIGIAWDVLWVALLGGTPGKLMLGLRVARADNGVAPPGWGKAALRALNRAIILVPIVGFLIWLLVGLASLVMLFADDQHRTVMDRIASTIVVRK